jgi:phytol kinase
MSPWLALVISFAYVFLVLAIGEGLRRRLGYSSDFTRKFIHVGVGMFSLLAVFIFERREWAIIPPTAFILINLLDWRFGLLQAMTSSDRSNLGTVYFPISFAVIIWFLWDHPGLLVGSLMPLTWGDAMAAVIGRRLGRHHYTVLGSTRSLEGSLALLVCAALPTSLALALFGVTNWLPVACVVAVGATVAEALSPWGTDNLTIPAVSAALLAWLAVGG